MNSNNTKRRIVLRFEEGVLNMQKSDLRGSFKLLKTTSLGSQYSELFSKNKKLVKDSGFFKDNGLLLEINESPDGIIYVDHVLARKRPVGRPCVFVIKKNVKVVVLERLVGAVENTSVKQSLSDFWVLEEGANMSHYWISGDGAESGVTQNKAIYQNKNSELSMFSVFCNNTNILNNIGVELSGKNALCRLNSISLLRRKAEVKHNIKVWHNSSNCTSEQLYKGVYSDSSTGCFDSVVVVEKDSQKTIAKQKNNNLLLSERANVQSNPQLEIFADDVECAHGATIGQISEEALFYLRSRGICLDVAQKLLTSAFLNEVTAKINHKEIADEVDLVLNRGLDSLYLQ